jgi:hypothetical protein
LSGGSNRFRLTDWPEFNVFVFALLLNYPWELMQMPLFLGMRETTNGTAIKVCTFATLGDGAIMLLAYWGTALLVQDRWWVAQPRWAPILTMIGIGVAITLLLEHCAIVSAWGWRYAENMPVVGCVPRGGVGTVDPR